jgi:hypothetical protein
VTIDTIDTAKASAQRVIETADKAGCLGYAGAGDEQAVALRDKVAADSSGQHAAGLIAGFVISRLGDADEVYEIAETFGGLLDVSVEDSS